jgi:O-antigen/teichoic acid export membrane protein
MSLWRPSAAGWAFWYRELWPVQWKVATTSLSSYFVNPLLVLVAFHYGDPVLAGQFGMSGAANILLLAIASAWVVTRSPRFAALVALGKSIELEQLFHRSRRAMLAVAVTGGAGLWMTVWALNYSEHPLAARLAPPLPMLLMILTTVLQTVTIGAITYARAHKVEALGLVSIASLLATVLGSVALTPKLGLIGIALAQLSTVALLQMPAALAALTRLRSEHRQSTIAAHWASSRS